LRKISRPVAVALSNETKETVNLGVLDGHELLYLKSLKALIPSHASRECTGF